MSEYIERIKRAVITTTSPDGSVKAKLDRTGVSVVLAPNAMNRHNEKTLAEQITKAVTAGRQGAGQAKNMILERTRGDRPDPDPELRKKWRDLDQATEGLVCTARCGQVEATRTGTGKTEVRLRPRTVGYLDPDQLADQVNEAIATTDREFIERVLDLRMSTFLGTGGRS